MTTAQQLVFPSTSSLEAPWVEIVVPVYNEERSLESSIRRLRSYLDRSFPFPSVVTVVDNGSTDGTALVAARLGAELGGVRVLRLVAKGRGRALRAAWSVSEARVVAYMDVDLSTSLDALLPLVAPLLSGHSDVSIGTRLARGARVVRGPKREVVSRLYNLVLKTCLGNGFSDAQCGFKAARTDVAQSLLPAVEDNAWFFDTEFLVVAERRGLRIHEVPVDWVDDPDSRVDIVATALEDLRGLFRLCLRRPATVTAEAAGDLPATVSGFARVGVVSTMAYLALFFVLAGALGPFGANVVALALCTTANTVVHRFSTFAGRGTPARRNLVLGGLVALGSSIAATSIALGVLNGVGATAPWLVGAALVVANLGAAAVRFVVLRGWMFATVTRDGAPRDGVTGGGATADGARTERQTR